MSTDLQRAPPATARTAMAPLRAFEGVGLEIEYMLVNRETLDVMPIADDVLRHADGTADYETPPNEVIERGYGWSNELVTHVLELKNAAPAPHLAEVLPRFNREVAAMNGLLRDEGARLMPGGMHPWMDPRSETRVWPHANAEVYRAYDRLFDCRRHGWANVQATHINLPFANDAEFERLHAAVRLVLPIIPALAASSPFQDGRAAGALDARLIAYRDNATRLPSITGEVIPDHVSSRAQYEHGVLAPMYRAIAPHDPRGVLQHEWLNSRGAIARFDRHAIEIRVMDVQECPKADVGIAAIVCDLVRALYEEAYAPLAAQRAIPTRALAHVLDACVRQGENALLDDREYLSIFDVKTMAYEARSLWRAVTDRLLAGRAPAAALWREPVEFVLEHGTLARRLLRAVGPGPSRNALHAAYEALCDALEYGELYRA